MITPSFSIVQDSKWLIFIIRAPYAKIADTEIEYGDDIFMFSAPPYYLRSRTASTVSGEFTVRVPKKNVGENFPGLDMISELLNPQKKISAQMLVEECFRIADDDEEDNSNDYFVEQNVVDIQAGCSENATDNYGYGFAWKRKGILGQLSQEIGDLVELKDPENCTIAERSVFIKLLTEQGIHLSADEQHAVALSLVDIVFAFAYDSRINDWETSCETGWNIAKLSPTLSFLCRWKSAKEAVIAVMRRSLCYPLYRNWDLSMMALNDSKFIISKGLGRTALLHILSKMHGILIGSGEFRYLFNDLFITDYCLWIQSVDESVLKTLQTEIAAVTKSDLELDLEELELEGQMARLKVEATPQLDSDDEPDD
ncbi:unnamed protein product [Heligmosomoides polygyrus]|uniref:Protein SHQ1 homolog n=1 Tax=Heligmosomoides polygyrus TaxID=6339 RepID=A0A3P8APK5_HELPZ|nr:unnamed protein product [Heligmosomoides polygyrus]